MMRFRILGVLEAHTPEGAVAISGRHHPRLLAMLLDEANCVVPTDRLAAGLWDERSPSTAARQVQNIAAALRRQLGGAGDRLRKIGSGYQIDVDVNELDVLRCKRSESLALEHRAAGRLFEAEKALDEALAEWRGPSLTGLSGRIIELAARRLDDYRLGLTEESIDIGLRLGRHAERLNELRRLCFEHPYRQRLAELLMLALYRCGQAPESLRVYAEIRSRLADELGADPGRPLRDLHTAILREDPVLDLKGREASATMPPATLPSSTTAFTGRSEYLSKLDESADSLSSPLVILNGVGGVGKTMLALHWGHRSANRFPGGEIYIDLRGFSPSGTVMEPDEAVRQLLGSMGVEPRRIPVDTEAQFTLYRSIIGSERRLLVLDNARDAAQVRPLLPNSPQVHTVVISRHQLVGLAASHGAKIIEIGAFDRTESAALLGRHLGRDRLAAELESVGRILTSCAGLPLALAIIGAKAATRPDHALSAIADELETARLDALTVDEASMDLRAVFSWSYRDLDAEAARIFRLLGLHPGPHMSVPAVASLADVPQSHARTWLARLCRVNLLTEPSPGRYALHDLLRAYAEELATSEESADHRSQATLRLIDHYVLTSREAALQLNPIRHTIASPPPTSIGPEEIEDSAAAVAWFRAEYPSIRQIAERASAAGLHTHTYHFAWNLRDFLYQQGHWRYMASIHAAALETAGTLEDRSLTAYAHRNVGVALTRLGKFDAAGTHLAEALALSRELGDHEGTATTEVYLAGLAEESGRFDLALEHAQRALQSAGNERGKAIAFNALAWTSILLGAHADAIEYSRQALEIWEATGIRAGTAHILATLGRAHHGLDQLDEALQYLRQSLSLTEELGNRYLEAEVLAMIGEVHHDSNRPDEAREAWRNAEAIYRALGHPEADELSAKLAG